MRRLDLTGHRYHRLVAVKQHVAPRSSWLCVCDCGNEVIVRATNLRSGNTKSCGCLQGHEQHGYSNTPEYFAFRNAKNRCERRADVRFEQYGAKGIEFRFATFSEFLSEVGPRPSPKHSLDRIDNTGHYEAGNVRWATLTEQARNRSTNRMISIAGQTRPLSEWSEVFGVPYKKAWERIACGGWSPERALEINDAQIAEMHVKKLWGPVARTVVHVERMSE